MKKTFFLTLPLLMLSACNNQPNESKKDDNGTVETQIVKRYDFELNKDNLWYFIDSAPSERGDGSYATLLYTFQGVLNYAYYDSVVVHFDYDIVGVGVNGNSYYPSTTHKADIEFKLNASGSGVLSLPYSYVPPNAVPTITQDSLYGFQRSLTIKSVSGTVRFVA